MRAGYWNTTNERTEPNYVMLKQLIPGFKITCICNFVDLYNTQVHIFFKIHNYMFKSILYVFSLVSSLILKKKGITIDY